MCGFPIQNTRTNLTNYLQGTRSSQKLFEKNRNFFQENFSHRQMNFEREKKMLPAYVTVFFQLRYFWVKKHQISKSNQICDLQMTCIQVWLIINDRHTDILMDSSINFQNETENMKMNFIFMFAVIMSTHVT